MLGVLLLSVAFGVLRHELQSYHLQDILSHLRAISTLRLGLAIALTVLGYLTLTGYDALGFRYARQALAYPRVALASFVAYVFSHNIGLSIFGSSTVRYRMHSSWGVPPDAIARIIVFATLTFWLGFLFVGGVSHVFWPQGVDLLPSLHLASSRPIGLAMLAVLAGYVGVVMVRRAPLRIRGFEVSLPGPSMTAAQVALSTLDWLLAASVLYVLLPAAPGLRFPVFMGAYVLAIAIGLASHVPGGLGVFETVMVLLLQPVLPGDQVLASILAYRVVYYLLPMGLAVVLFAGYELREGGAHLERIGGRVKAWMLPVAPRLFAVTTFLAGAMLLLSSVTPEVPQRLAWLREILPLPMIEITNLLGSIFGVQLLLLANALRERVDAAYYGTLALLVGGALVSLARGLAWEQASILAVMALALWPCRPFFDRRSSLGAQRLSLGWWGAVAVVALGSLLALELAYRHVEYSNELWWRFSPGSEAPRSLRAALAAGVSLLAIGGARLLRPAPPVPDPPTSGDLDRAQAIVARSARVDGYLALLGDKELLFDDASSAFVMFGVSGRTWVAMGDPMGAPDQQEALAWRLRELADQHGARTVFYEVSGENLPIYLDLGLELRKLGEVGRVSLPDFSLDGRRRSDLRQARNRMAREGARFEILESARVPAVLDELEAISLDWLAAKHTREKRFSLGFFDRGYLSRLPLAVVRRDDEILGFANMWPSDARQEFSIDLMRYRSDAPKGVMEFLFAELMTWARDDGYQWFSLGMAPLSGLEHHRLAPLWNRLGALLFRHGEHFYNFRGLREFKEKFDPQWEPRYLAAPGGLSTPLVLTRVAGLVSGGVAGVVAR
jgi:phosphatidylglycerol lysyltransferase